MSTEEHLASIIERLRNIEDGLKQCAQAIDKASDRNKQQNQEPVAVNAVIRQSEAVEREQTTRQDDAQRTQNIIAVAACFAFVAALAYAVIAQLTLGQIREQTAQIYRQSDVENAGASHKAAEDFAQLKVLQEQAGAAQASAVAIQNQLRQQERTFRIEERPYVSLENIRFDPPLEQNHLPATIKWDFHNAGKTPALKVTFTIDGFFDNTKIAEAPRDFDSEMTIASDRSTGGQIRILIQGPGDFERIMGGTERFSIKGTITYWDIFKESHPTTFCAVYDPKSTRAWVYCPGGDIQ